MGSSDIILPSHKENIMKKFFADFKKFISRGNIIDMAIGVIVGSAFSAIVKALTDKIIMPVINYLLSLGGTGLSSAFTFLKKATTVDASGATVVDLANSIYIDWGAFITAILNFFIIALTLFIILKVAMKSSEMIKKTGNSIKKSIPTKEEKKELKANGVDMKDRQAVLVATKELRARKEAEAKANVPPPKPTTEELLTEILTELKKNNKDETAE